MKLGGISNSKHIGSSRSHTKIFSHFGETFGLNETDLENGKMRKYTREMLNKMENLFVYAPFIEAIGGISPGIENIFYRWIGIIHERLQAQYRFTEKALYHFKLHSTIDHEHGNHLKNSILPYLHQNTTNQKLLRRGALTTAMAQCDFLIGLQKDFESL